MIKIAFFGTGNFAAKILKALLTDREYAVNLVITQPDRKIGRVQKIEQSPVKILAKQNHKLINQPESLKNNFETSLLADIDLNIVCQYGLIIPSHILNIPRHQSINIHASLLPKYRGASPIQTALINGEKTTGITIILMDSKMDHGPILSQTKIIIASDDNNLTLSDKLAKAAIPLLFSTSKQWVEGKITPQPQDKNAVTFCKILNREDGYINFTKTAEQIFNQYRGLYSWPGIWTMLGNKRLKLIQITKANKNNLQSGHILIDSERVYIGCNNNTSIEALELQLEGKKQLPAKKFLQGAHDINGKILN